MTHRAMIFARALLLVTVLTSGYAHAAAEAWNFTVFLDGKPIGHHDFTLTSQDMNREMKSDARFDARFYAIFSYHYAHDAVEHWDGNCLIGLAASTDDDGKKSSVNAVRQDNALMVSGPNGPMQYQGCVMTFSYWNPQMLKQSHLLNPQTGEVEAVRIEPLGKELITVRGAQVNANHYRVSGPKHPINLWYSDAGEWLALSSQLDGDRQLEYQLQ
jgi:hypothetical protein